MATAVVATAAALYLLSAAAYGAAFVRPALTRTARVAFALAVAGFVVHGVAIGTGCRETGGQHLLTAAGAAGLVGWIAAGVFLVVQRTFRKPSAGAFAIPLVLVAMLPGAFASEASGRHVTAALATIPAVRVHVIAATAGIALFALACAFGVMYLLQERELKQKRFGPLLTRLPSLHAMDRTNSLLVAVGFAVFTVALVSGSFLARSAWCSAWEWDGQQVASLVRVPRIV
jgi:HemX protein